MGGCTDLVAHGMGFSAAVCGAWNRVRAMKDLHGTNEGVWSPPLGCVVQRWAFELCMASGRSNGISSSHPQLSSS